MKYRIVNLWLFLLIINVNIFAQCAGPITSTLSPAPLFGNTYNAGQIDTFCVTVNGFNASVSDWFHGLTLNFGPGWDTNSFTVISYPTPANPSAGSSPDSPNVWGYFPLGVTGLATGFYYGSGFYFETGEGNDTGIYDGNPGDNYGDDCVSGNCVWTFCFSLQVSFSDTPGTSLSLSVTPTADGQSGDWTQGAGACNDPPTIISTSTVSGNIIASIAGDSVSCFGTCNGSATASVFGGTPPFTFVWSTNPAQTTQSISNLCSGLYTCTVSDSVNNTATATYVVTQLTQVVISDSVHICSGSLFTFGNQTISQTGTYYDTLTDAQGCDSITILNIQFDSILRTGINTSICDGSSYLFGSSTITAAGTFYDTVTAQGGCDSIITLTLLVHQSPGAILTDSICPGTNFIFNGRTILSAGTYYDTLLTSGGCDSIVTLNLKNGGHYPVDTIQITICQNTIYNFYGRSVSVAGVYKDTVYNGTGCDSIITLLLWVHSPPAVSWNVKDTLCTNGTNALSLPPGAPAGGTYTGVGVTGDSLYTNNAGSPPYIITYTVVDSNQCSNSVSDTFVAEICTGVLALPAQYLVKLYPNPVVETLTVECPAFIPGSPVPLIYDITGKQIELIYERQVGKFIFHTNQLAGGVHFMRLNAQGANAIIKFVKLD